MIQNIKFYTLKQYTFVDSEDVEPGSIEDLVLSAITLEPTHLILGAGFYEEFLEEVGDREDIDEIAELKIMEMKDDIISLNQNLESMPHTDKNGNLPFEAVLFSEINQFEIHDNNMKHDADIPDFLISETSSLIVQSYTLQSEMNKRGYKQKIELIIPLSMVKLDHKNKIIKLLIDLDNIIEKIENEVQVKFTGKSVINLAN